MRPLKERTGRLCPSVQVLPIGVAATEDILRKQFCIFAGTCKMLLADFQWRYVRAFIRAEIEIIKITL